MKNTNYKRNKTHKQRSTVPKAVHPSKVDNALLLKPEYKGQPVVALKIKGVPTIITTAVTSGLVNTNATIQVSLIQDFASRFTAFTEARMVKAKATFKSFGSTTVGLANMWFTEDDSSAPTASKALHAPCKQFNFSNVVGGVSVEYVPHDPAQQTWTLQASGNPAIGYFKFYTDAANFGAPIAVTAVGIVTFDFTVQFRGLI